MLNIFLCLRSKFHVLVWKKINQNFALFVIISQYNVLTILCIQQSSSGGPVVVMGIADLDPKSPVFSEPPACLVW